MTEANEKKLRELIETIEGASFNVGRSLPDSYIGKGFRSERDSAREAIVSFVREMCEELIQRRAVLLLEAGKLDNRIDAMAKLLDSVEHTKHSRRPCAPDPCLRCAWEKLKG